jgi:hypothetical protein
MWVLQVDLIIFVVYTTDDVSYNAYIDALKYHFPRSRIGSSVMDRDDDESAKMDDSEA